MRTVRFIATLVGRLAVLIAKTIGGMSGAKTFDQDGAVAAYQRPEEYRP